MTSKEVLNTININVLPDEDFLDDALDCNVENVYNLVKSGVSFNEIVDKYKYDLTDISWDWTALGYLLMEEGLFKRLIEEDLIGKTDVKYLLTEIDDFYLINTLFDKNKCLTKYVLENFLLDFSTVKTINEVLNDEYASYAYDDGSDFENWIESRDPEKSDERATFEFIRHVNSNSRCCSGSISSKLIDLNEKVYLLNNFNLSKDQKLEIAEILKDNTNARNVLIQLVENHLEDQYDFDRLKDLLTKDDKKKKIKMNF